VDVKDVRKTVKAKRQAIFQRLNETLEPAVNQYDQGVQRIENHNRLSWLVTSDLALPLIVFGFLAILPFISMEVHVSVATTMIIFGIFAMAFDLAYGYTGMPSFGHAAFFGLGGYTVGLLLMGHGIENLWLLILAAMLVALLYGVITGFISTRARFVYFAILTLAFAQVTYVTFHGVSDITGGSDGLIMTLPKLTLIPGVLTVDLYDTTPMYYFVFLSSVLSFAFLYKIIQSPLGQVFIGTRENYERMKFIGYNERAIRVLSFSISGMISGLAGALYVINIRFVSPENLFFFLSGELIVWTVLGGVGTLIGPFIGAGVVHYLEYTMSDILQWWLIPVGLTFIIVVIFFPKGFIGIFRRYR